MPDQIEELLKVEAEIQEFLQGLASSGRFEHFSGLVTGWTLWIDRLNLADSERWWSALSAPEQAASHTVGMAESLKEQALKEMFYTDRNP